jgi:hypothetical protein
MVDSLLFFVTIEKILITDLGDAGGSRKIE